jgi:hypothetical protein
MFLLDFFIGWEAGRYNGGCCGHLSFLSYPSYPSEKIINESIPNSENFRIFESSH